ncbi:MAG: hypothetical protein ACR2ND_00710 [Solirubrobacteraceae bacterium]
MGKRSRKRGGSNASTPRSPASERAPADLAAPPAAARRRPRIAEAPAAPWAPFPLVELCILLALILIGLGFFSSGARGRALFGAGLTLVSLAALELTIREHFGGYRSHSALLAGAGAVVSGALLYFLVGAPRGWVIVAGAGVFAALWRLLRAAFIARAGVGFRA